MLDLDFDSMKKKKELKSFKQKEFLFFRMK